MVELQLKPHFEKEPKSPNLAISMKGKLFSLNQGKVNSGKINGFECCLTKICG